MTKKYCVIGYPIAHSLSPVIHNALYEMYGLDCQYTAYPVDHQSLDSFVGQIHSRGICGFNITMPLKQDILSHLDFVAHDAQDSINTVVVDHGKLCGYSTDAQGFYASLRSLGADYSDKNVVFIGAGAVTSLLCMDAASKQAKSIAVVNRTPCKAQKIAESCHAKAAGLDRIQDFMLQCDLLVNTTPLGMSGTGHNFENLDFIDLLPTCATVCDLIYSPPETDFLMKARTRGLQTMNGLGMLIWQAFYAFEKFCGILPTPQDYQTILSKIKQSDQ